MNIKKIREKLGNISQEAFGKLISKSRSQIARYEAGEPIPFHTKEYIKIKVLQEK